MLQFGIYDIHNIGCPNAMHVLAVFPALFTFDRDPSEYLQYLI